MLRRRAPRGLQAYTEPVMLNVMLNACTTALASLWMIAAMLTHASRSVLFSRWLENWMVWNALYDNYYNDNNKIQAKMK